MTGVLPDMIPFFARYERFAREADALFERIRGQHPELVLCREQCSSCCHALFDLTLVEALYLNTAFRERFPSGAARASILEAADAADRQAARIKRKAFKDSRAGRDGNEILAEIAAASIRCPLLDTEERCLLYEVRPITCRLYGVPAAIDGKARSCGKTGFVQGNAYPTVALDKIQERLRLLSEDMAAASGTAYARLSSMYVPVSTALLTEFDAAYLGIGGIPKEHD
jgi:Fe-S-cluster containining protein